MVLNDKMIVSKLYKEDYFDLCIHDTAIYNVSNIFLCFQLQEAF